MQVLVMAMHRSGSSLCTRLLSFMGIQLGPGQALLPPQPDNPKGFWERSDVQVLHDRVLEMMGHSWYDMATLDMASADQRAVELFRSESRNILRELETLRPWGLKDPRLCIFFPWWRDILEAPVLVHIYRSPLQVANSLLKRNRMPLPVGLALWEAYNVLALKACRDVPHVRVSFTRLIRSPMNELRAVFTALEAFGVTGIHMPSEKEVSHFLNTDLVHHHPTPEEEAAVLTGAQERLWRVMEGDASRASSFDLTVSRLATETLRYYGDYENQATAMRLRQEELARTESSEKERHRRDLDALRDESARHEKAAQDAQARCDALSAENATLARDRKQLESLRKELQKKVSGLEDTDAAANRTLSENERMLKIRRNTIDTLEAERHALRRVLDRHAPGNTTLADALHQFERQYEAARHTAGQHQEAVRRHMAISREHEQALMAIRQSRSWRWGRRLFGPLGVVMKTCKKMTSGENDIPTAPDSRENAPPVSGVSERPAGQDVFLARFLSFSYSHPAYPVSDSRAPVDIILPIYNGFELLGPLFESLFKNTTMAYRLILVNDACTDQAVTGLLEDLAEKNDAVRLIVNKENMGFVGSVNRAAAVAENHFVILNSDVVVPPHWLERLMRPILQLPNIASATPFTNAGTICSFPDFPNDSDLFAGLSPEAIDWGFAHVNPADRYFELPTGVGFCMAVNKNTWRRIGPLDTDAFGAGYGEENDWCLRAKAHGFKNVMVPNLFVYHKHGGTFSASRKKTQLEKNLPLIHRRYPAYGADVDRFVRRDPARPIRQWVGLLLTACRRARKVTLIVDHQLGGGANYYCRKFIEERKGKSEAFLIMTYDFQKGYYRIEYSYESIEPVEFFIANPGVFQQLEGVLPIHEIIINNLVSYPDPMGILDMLHRIKSLRGARMIFCAHDYFVICPSCNLVDDTQTYCDVSEPDHCLDCIERNKQVWRDYRKIDVARWRQAWQCLLNNCDEILCFSESSRDILQKVYPLTDPKRFVVQPHRVSDIRTVSRNGHKNKRVRTIGVIGHLATHKGRSIVLHMNEKIVGGKLDLRIVLIGEFPLDADPGPGENEVGTREGIIVTGRYRREELPDIMENYGVDIALVPSIWPETFSYVTEECIQMGVPVAVFDLGAPAERVRKYERGLVIEKIDAELALDRIADYLGGAD